MRGYYVIHSHDEEQQCTKYCYPMPTFWNRIRATIRAKLIMLTVSK